MTPGIGGAPGGDPGNERPRGSPEGHCGCSWLLAAESSPHPGLWARTFWDLLGPSGTFWHLLRGEPTQPDLWKLPSCSFSGART